MRCTRHYEVNIVGGAELEKWCEENDYGSDDAYEAITRIIDLGDNEPIILVGTTVDGREEAPYWIPLEYHTPEHETILYGPVEWEGEEVDFKTD